MNIIEKKCACVCPVCGADERTEDDENKSKEPTQLKVGEVGFLCGKKVRCRLSRDVLGIACNYCAFSDRAPCIDTIPCFHHKRDDGLSVYYEEVK